jgi:hypothetical protein
MASRPANDNAPIATTAAAGWIAFNARSQRLRGTQERQIDGQTVGATKLRHGKPFASAGRPSMGANATALGPKCRLFAFCPGRIASGTTSMRNAQSGRSVTNVDSSKFAESASSKKLEARAIHAIFVREPSVPISLLIN